MQNTFDGFLIRLLVACMIALCGWLYFGIVLPPAGAGGIAVALAVAELFAPLLAGRQGASLRWLFRIAMPLVAWPALAWLVGMYVHSRGVSMAAAAAAAAMLGVLAAGHGQGHEHARLGVVLVACLIPLIALFQCLRAGDQAAAAVGCIAVAVGFVAAKLSLVWPERLEDTLVWGAVAAVVAGVATAIPVIL